MNVDIQSIFQILTTDKNFSTADFSTPAELAHFCLSKNVPLNKGDENRLLDELIGLGPVQSILDDPSVTEILINSHNEIFLEKSGVLERSKDYFYTEQSYLNFVERLSSICHGYLNRERPYIEYQWQSYRVSLIFAELSRGQPLVSIRKQSNQIKNLQQLQNNNFLKSRHVQIIKELTAKRQNILVVGPTGAGKTTLLQAIMNEADALDRFVTIEDTQELSLPNPSSVSLVTRSESADGLKCISMDDLIRRALRLRPDRLVVGEIRGPEAQSLLMALATGHSGSMGSLHARTAPEALFRLEMLVQMGAPQWSLLSIRRLLSMTVDYILVVGKIDGQRQLISINKICSYEETGLTMEEI